MDMTTPKYLEIIGGERIAAKIKKTFWPDMPWSPTVASEVAAKMTALKRITRDAYSHLDNIQFLHRLSDYNEQDIKDALYGK